MKSINALTSTIAASLLSLFTQTDANAVSLNSQGIGQVLLYPYYTVNGGNQTLVSVVNTTDKAKALRIKFLEGMNSKDVLSFNIYLGPFDTWGAALFATGSIGPANLLTIDQSCTVPNIVTNNLLPTFSTGLRYVPFRNFAYTGTNSDFPVSTPNLGALERTREGHIEVYELGELSSGTGPAQLAEEASPGQNSNGVPTNCGALVAAWLPNGAWANNPSDQVGLPTGGLYGAVEIIDILNGTNISANAEALQNFYTDTSAPGFLHSAPGSSSPDLRSADNGNVVQAKVLNAETGDAMLEEFPVGGSTPDAVSTLLMQNSIFNEFNIERGLAAKSEWVVTLPTKRFYVDVPFDSGVSGPFNESFRDDGQSCHSFKFQLFSRHGINILDSVTLLNGNIGTPPLDGSRETSMCAATNVITFNQDNSTSDIFKSSRPVHLRHNEPELGTAGQLNLDLSNRGCADPLNSSFVNCRNFLSTSSQRRYFGLPVIGFWAANYVNAAAAPGLLANFSAAHKHRGRIKVSGGN